MIMQCQRKKMSITQVKKDSRDSLYKINMPSYTIDKVDIDRWLIPDFWSHEIA